ncbi:MAG: SBBP repeat-containing protein [candidate division Zixibacteria bacterium]|nr:SBBP repeat-containing protein [candidate division Zixibacteria bacterium]
MLSRLVLMVVTVSLLTVLLVSNPLPAADPIPLPAQLEAVNTAAFSFTPNLGQWPDHIRFRAAAANEVLWLAADGVYFQFLRHKPGTPVTTSTSLESNSVYPEYDGLLVKATFVDANASPRFSGESVLEHKHNYFLGNDSTRWRTDVPNFEALVISELYDGIDLRYHFNAGKIEYDVIVKPGADPGRFRVRYDNVRDLDVAASGDLVVTTAWSTITESAPLIFQEQQGSCRPVTGGFTRLDDNSFAFALADDYDQARPLVIDPTLTFSTFLGGASSDLAYDIAVTPTGEVFITGVAWSSDFPTVNAYDNTFAAATDVFVSEFNASGAALLYSTFLGGIGPDYPYTLALEGSTSSAAVYVAGETFASNFPMVGAIDATLGGSDDAFVAKIGSGGSSLPFSTFLGGSQWDRVNDIALRCPFPCSTPTMRVFVVGATASSDFPLANAYQTTVGGVSDAFLTQYSVSSISGNSLVYSTFLGGSGGENAYAVTVQGSSAFKPYVAGATSSTNFPTVNAYDATFTGQVADAFITGFDIAGNGSLYALFSTYFGGADSTGGTEFASEILLRGNGNIVIAGMLNSPGLGTPGVYQPSFAHGDGDGFVAEFTPLAASLLRCTYLGGSSEDIQTPQSTGLATDASGALYFSGTTTSANFPTAEAYDSTYNGVDDVFVAKFSSDLSALQFCTYLGGTSDDRSTGIAVDPSGCAYVTGSTASVNFPIVAPYDGSMALTDAFLTKICLPSYVCGDADGSGSVTVSDVVYLINYIFAGGPAPNPLLSGDVDCTGAVSISDAVYLINYIFAGGPAPCAACP